MSSVSKFKKSKDILEFDVEFLMDISSDDPKRYNKKLKEQYLLTKNKKLLSIDYNEVLNQYKTDIFRTSDNLLDLDYNSLDTIFGLYKEEYNDKLLQQFNNTNDEEIKNQLKLIDFSDILTSVDINFQNKPCEELYNNFMNIDDPKHWKKQISKVNCHPTCDQLKKIYKSIPISDEKRREFISYMAEDDNCRNFSNICDNETDTETRLKNGCEPECSQNKIKYINTNDKDILKSSRNCDWYDDLTKQILRDTKEGEEYSSNNTIGTLYSIYLAIKYQQCSILELTRVIRFEWSMNTAVKFPFDIIAKIDKCSRRLILVPIHIELSSGAHYNAGIIDKGKSPITFERFEPHGETHSYDFTRLDNELKIILATYNIVYIPPSDFCPNLGPQKLDHAEQIIYSIPKIFKGFCQAWGSWYYEKRMEDPDKPIKNLLEDEIQKLHTIPGEAIFIRYIVKYSYYMTNLRNEIIVKHVSEDVSTDDINKWILYHFDIISDAIKEYINNNGKVTLKYEIIKEDIKLPSLKMVRA